MESPRTGIVLLLAVGLVSVVGAVLGWQVRQQEALQAAPARPENSTSEVQVPQTEMLLAPPGGIEPPIRP